MEKIQDIHKAKDAFLSLLAQLGDQVDFHDFESFVTSALGEYHQQVHQHDDDQDMSVDEEEHDGAYQPVSDLKMMRLGRIVEDLRQQVPLSAEAPDEKIVIPDSKEFADYNEKNTVHVDSFLYNEEHVDELCDEGQLSRNYCLDCQSRNVAPLNFISHSASVLQLQFLYQVALANKTKDKTIVDVGSRLGAVLYTGHLFTRAKRIIGVEINDWFCQLQQKTIKKYKMDDRVKVLCQDIQAVPELLNKDADVVIMNNVFQFFNDLPTQQKIWQFVRNETRKKSGLLLVTLPSLQEQLKEAGLSPNKLLKGWVKEVKLNYDGGWFEHINDDELEEIQQVHVYKVL
ncbi:S-adenosyl-L-methionine-dependent methyltransferase [Gongronella butleri]|nr:S-adenosyl-L-methionine-dependent methyltransferase [Gongronella butleri]